MRHGLCSTLLTLLTACGSPQAHPDQAPSGKTPRHARSDAPGQRSHLPAPARIASEKLVDRRERTALAPDALDVLHTAAPAPKSATELYRHVAPATVIVRVSSGMGTGVLIHPKGWVLTNHHVIAEGKEEDFHISVGLSMGRFSKKSGGMERGRKQLRATVYKADKLRDLALLKIDKPPAKLPFLRLAEQIPSPGLNVRTVGHAGAGMLWAMKSGSVSATGKLTEHLAQLAHFKDDDSGREALAAFRRYIESKHLGLVLQSTCAILPGDSGGALVNTKGEIVGLNAFSRKDPRTGGLTNFHVHLAEIRKFLREWPKSPQSMLPDPWTEGGGDMAYGDANLDGAVDALVLRGRPSCLFCPRQSSAVMIDADQNSFPTGSALPTLEQVFESRRFDAELIFLRRQKHAYLWYDRDNDGRLDHLIVDEGTTGKSSRAYRIAKDGNLRRQPPTTDHHAVQPALFRDPELRAKLTDLAKRAFPDSYYEAKSDTPRRAPPPWGRTGRVVVKDRSGDGKADSIHIESAFSRRLLIDLDQNAAPALPENFALASRERPQDIDAELAIVSQGAHMWVWYDGDDDGRFERLLYTPDLRTYAATEAWLVSAQGHKKPLADAIGRKMGRPGLFQDAALRQKFTALAKRAMPSIVVAQSQGLASFPDPIEDHRGAGFTWRPIKGAKRAVLEIEARGSVGFLVGLGRKAVRGPKLPARAKDGDKEAQQKAARKALQSWVEEGNFVADFAYFLRNGLAWSYYDSDGDKRYDLVLYSAAPKQALVERAYRISADGTVTLASDLHGKRLVDPSYFKRQAQRKKMKRIAAALFEH